MNQLAPTMNRAASRGYRFFSSTRAAMNPKPLPFEKPIFESEILDKARADQQFHSRFETVGNVLVIGVCLSLLGRIGYYVTYGKEGGAGPLPRRDRKRD